MNGRPQPQFSYHIVGRPGGIAFRILLRYNKNAMTIKMEEGFMKKFLQEFKAFALRGNVLTSRSAS